MVEKTRRRRRRPFRVDGYTKDQLWIDNPQYGIPGYVPYSSVFSGHQKTVSEGHPFTRLGKSGEDIGGNFRTESVELYTKPYRFENRGPRQSYSGYLLAGNAYRDAATVEQFDFARNGVLAPDSFLDERGTTAIARTAPTNPVSSAATFLGELREGLPSIPGWKSRSGLLDPKNLGSEHLNIEFGIKPLISDLQKFVEAAQKSDKILEQLERDSGKMVRRRYTFPPEIISDVETVQTGMFPVAFTSLQTNQIGKGTLTTRTKTTRKVWFSGAFTYYLPPKGTWMRTLSEIDKLYGVEITPDTIWQLTPWSWAVDWFSNTGDVIKNVSNFASDGLVLRYGYVMCETKREVTQTWDGGVYYTYGGPLTPLRLEDKFAVIAKQRRAATPFGFGLNLSALTGRQAAIVAALGMSRGR